jgi:hypothetical protein
MPARRHVIVSLGGMEAGGIRAITSRRKARTAKMRLAIYASTFELHIAHFRRTRYINTCHFASFYLVKLCASKSFPTPIFAVR